MDIRNTHRKQVRMGIMLILGVSVFICILSQISFEELAAVLSSVDIRYLFAAVLTSLAVTVVRVIRYERFFHFPGQGSDH